MPAPSLVALCTKSCIKNVARLTDVGDFEYWKIQPILARVTAPEQLHVIELASPQIRGEDAGLWKAFIARDVPNWKEKNYVPKNPFKWYEIYLKYMREQKRDIEKSRDMLSAAMQDLEREKLANVSRVVKARYLPRQPKDPRMLSNDGGVPIGGRRKAAPKPAQTTMNFTAGSKTKMKDAGSVLIRARREAKAITDRTRLAIPSHQLKSGASQVTQAPRHMIEKYRKAAEPQRRIYPPARAAGATGSIQQSASGPSLEEKERRLRALTISSHGPGVTLVSSDSDDNSDDIDDLFEERVPQNTSSPPIKPHSKQETRFNPSSTNAKAPQASRTIPKPKPMPVRVPPVRKPSDIITSIIANPKPAHAKASPVREPSEISERPIATPKPRRQAPAPVTSFPPSAPVSPARKSHNIWERPLAKPKSKSQPPSSIISSLPAPTTSPGAVTAVSAVPVRHPGQPPNIIRKRKAEVDIFNRGGSATKEKRVRQV